MENDKRSWAAAVPPWQLYIFLIIAEIVIGSLYFIPKIQADHFRALISSPQKENIKTDQLTAKEFFEIENESRKTLAQIFGGIFVLIGIYLAFRRQTVAEETLRVTERGQITDRFTKAIEQLGKDRLELRLGAIYALEKIAHDSADYHWQVMEVLTAYVRDRYPWKEGTVSQPEYEVPLDVEAIMTVLCRRKHERETAEQTISLEGTDLRNVNLIKANLQGTNFGRTNLDGAQFAHANLQGSWFSEANLKLVRFQGADLRRATRLTQTQIDSASCDEKTVLPEGLNNVKALENWRKFQDWLKPPKNS